MRFDWSAIALSCAALVLAIGPLSTPARAQEQAVSANSFINSIGVVTHFGYEDTPADPYHDYASVKNMLVDLGVRHIRDGSDIQKGSSKLYMQKSFRQLYDDAGIRTLFVVTPNYGATPADVVSAIETITPAALDGVEGPNEPDLSAYTYGKLTGYDAVKQWMNDIYPLIKSTPQTSSVAVVAPAMGDGGGDNEAKIAPLSAFDFQSTHNYQAGLMPTATLGRYIEKSNQVVGAGHPLKPIIATESGYSAESGNDWPVSLKAQCKYTARLLLEDYLARIRRTYLYQLVEEGGNTFGLATATMVDGKIASVNERPAYRAVKNLIGVLNDGTWDPSQHRWTARAFRPGALRFRIDDSAPASVHHLLIEKSDGAFELLLWNEVSVYDRDRRADISNPPASVRIAFPGAANGSVVQRTLGDDGNLTPAAPTSLSSGLAAVEVPDSLTILEIRTSPGA